MYIKYFYLIGAILLFGLGIFTIFCSVKEKKWFFKNFRTQHYTEKFGFKFMKILFVVTGIIIVLFGVEALSVFFNYR